MSGLVIKSAPHFALSLQGAACAVVSAISTSFALLAAAGAASQAVELHRQPDEADLQKLGMSGVSFKPYI